MEPQPNGDASAIIKFAETHTGFQHFHDVTDTGLVSFAASPSALDLVNLTELHDLDQYRKHPRWLKETLRTDSADGLLEYLQAHKTNDTVVFVDTEHQQIEAVIDYHGAAAKDGKPSQPSHCRHKAHYKPKFSDRFAAWRDVARACFGAPIWLSAPDLVRHLDKHGSDIIAVPRSMSGVTDQIQDALCDILGLADDLFVGKQEGSEIVGKTAREKLAELPFGGPAEISAFARKATITIKGKVSDHVDLRTGSRSMQASFDNEPTIDGQRIVPPTHCMIAVPIFVGVETQVLPVAIAWRVKDEKPEFSLELLGVRELIRKTLLEIASKIAAEAGLRLIEGSVSQ